MRVEKLGFVGPALLAVAWLSGCKKEEAPPPPTFTVGGTVSGLTGSVILANNGGDPRTVSANGGFTFATALNSGAAYNVTVSTQPPNQTCTVVGGTGSVAANVSSVAVSCVTTAFSVGGTVTGLSGSVTLTNNGGDARSVNADGVFTFATGLATGSAYNVTVGTQPTNQTCTVASATGTMAAVNVSNVAVTCVTYRVVASIGAAGGALTHPDGAEVVIPAGALTQAIDIAIARRAAGGPALLDVMDPAEPVYEITPHDYQFHKPVLIRLPAPATSLPMRTFVSSFGDDWESVDAALNGNRLEFERNTFSFYHAFGCDTVGQITDPYYCTFPSGYAWPTASSGGALLQVSGGAGSPHELGSANNTAGYWHLHDSAVASLQMNMQYSAAPDCGGAHVLLKRIVPGGNPVQQVISDTPAPILDGRGRLTVPVPASELSSGLNTFVVTFKCQRPSRPSDTGGSDVLTIEVVPTPLNGFSVGGTVTGLNTAGLELQDGTRETLVVPAGSNAFTFSSLRATGAAYNVRIRQQPSGALCATQQNRGSVTGDVTNIQVACVPTAAQAASFSIITTNNPRVATLLRRAQGAGDLTALGNVSVGSEPLGIAVTAQGSFAYVASQFSDSVQAFAIQRGMSPALVTVNSRFVPGPSAIAIDPLQERFLWVTHNGAGAAISTYSIDPQTGALSPVGGAVGTGGAVPSTVAPHPNGNFVYVTNSASTSVSTFSVDRSTGALTMVGIPLGQSVSGPSLLVAPSGLFMYGMDSRGGLTRFTVNGTTGAIAVQGFAFTPSVSSCYKMVMRPNGRSLYLACTNVLGASINAFDVDTTTGVMTWRAATPLGANGACSVSIEPDGDFLHAIHTPSNRVYSFSIDANGALTATGSAATSTGPVAIASTVP